MYFTLDWLLYYTDRKDIVEPLIKKYKEIKGQIDDKLVPNDEMVLLIRKWSKYRDEILLNSERSWKDIVL